MSAVIMDGVALAERIKTNIWRWSKKLPYVPPSGSHYGW